MGRTEKKVYTIAQLKREIITAWENSKAADTMGRYAEASWWEGRAIELSEELKRRKS